MALPLKNIATYTTETHFLIQAMDYPQYDDCPYHHRYKKFTCFGGLRLQDSERGAPITSHFPLTAIVRIAEHNKSVQSKVGFVLFFFFF